MGRAVGSGQARGVVIRTKKNGKTGSRIMTLNIRTTVAHSAGNETKTFLEGDGDGKCLSSHTERQKRETRHSKFQIRTGEGETSQELKSLPRGGGVVQPAET